MATLADPLTLPSFESCPRLTLAAHVLGCRVGEHAIFLDVRRDRYFGASVSACDALRAHVAGLPGSNRAIANGSEPLNAEARSLLSELQSGGMLVRYPSTSVESDRVGAAPFSIPRATGALIEGSATVRPALPIGSVVQFFRATAKAGVELRWRSLEKAIESVRRDRRHGASREIDLDDAREKVERFQRLRPLAYTANEACLFNSLALYHFLANCQLRPFVVIGVATDPFRAHCWLQYKHIVFNDAPEYVREFTPILIA